MAYLGRYQQGDQVPLQVLCVNAQGVPTVPEDVPRVRLFTPDGRTVTAGLQLLTLPPIDRYGTTALFGFNIPVGPAWAIAGNWRIVVTYSIGSYSGLDESTFEVVTGGVNQANVISMWFYKRPDADFIVYQADGSDINFIGDVRAGRNPRI